MPRSITLQPSILVLNANSTFPQRTGQTRHSYIAIVTETAVVAIAIETIRRLLHVGAIHVVAIQAATHTFTVHLRRYSIGKRVRL